MFFLFISIVEVAFLLMILLAPIGGLLGHPRYPALGFGAIFIGLINILLYIMSYSHPPLLWLLDRRYLASINLLRQPSFWLLTLIPFQLVLIIISALQRDDDDQDRDDSGGLNLRNLRASFLGKSNSRKPKDS